MKQLSLSERIAQRVQSTKTNRARNNLLAFLALRDDIKQALNDSYTKKEIWETLRDEQKIAFGYTSFTRYVNRLILCNNKQEIHTKEESESVKKQTAKPDEQQNVTPKEKKEDVITNFVFKPIQLTKDDL
jgi:hypothetical protein